jgi:hypothetical protein
MEYIRDQLADLRAMALMHEAALLAYLIEMAFFEAADLARADSAGADAPGMPPWQH